MGIIDMEELAGIHSENGQIICAECVEDEELAVVNEDEIITQTEIENADTKAYFCNSCKKRM